MPHQWTDLEIDQEADALLSGLGVEPDETPVVVASGGEILRNPGNTELGRAIGLGSSGPPPALCDVIVVGAGPAGLAASLSAASEGSTFSASRRLPRGARSARQPGSRTISAFQPGYRAAS